MFSIILCNPQMGENIGAAARAMFNFGLCDLRLVNPRDGWPNERAETMSTGALEQMPPVQIFDTLPQAIADLHFVLGTTARERSMVKPLYTPQSAIAHINQRASTAQRSGILFGAERSGLLNDEVAACHGIITIPTNPNFSSLNLGQSVLLMAYEWIRSQQSESAPDKIIDNADSPPAIQSDLENFLSRLENDLEDNGFFRSEGLMPTMKRNIRNIFTRADITEQELRTLHGVITSLKRPAP